MENEERNAGAARRLGPGTWVLMALVAVVTLIAFWMVPKDDQDAASILPELPPAPEATEQSLQPAGPNLSETPGSSSGAQPSSAAGESRSLDLPLPPGGVATVTGGGEGARTFLYELRASGGEPDPDVVFAEAERLQGQDEREDAYLLYRYAARHGQAQAAMKLGTAADPAYHSAENSYLPEAAPGQARKWYSLAAAAGNQEAGQRLEDLRGRLERDAAAGDEQARRLLLLWR
ncbi:MAG: hypothetical protein PVJ66_00735 [Gammaproteobacteria bacterium]|jgi:hypothetical protein